MTDAVPVNQAPSSVELVEKELSYRIVAAFFEVYNTLGIGFLESVYSRALDVAFQRRGIFVEREVPTTVFFHGIEVGRHRADLLVEGRIIVEIKATERLSDAAKRQVRSYLSAFNLELGLILHFGPRAEVYRVLRRAQSLTSSAGTPTNDSNSNES